MTKEEFREKLMELLLAKNMTKDKNEKQLIQMQIDDLKIKYKRSLGNKIKEK